MNTRSTGRGAAGRDAAAGAEAPVLLQLEGPIARVTLNRPASGNAIDLDLARELMHALQACEHHAGLHAVVLSGAGRLFCAGGDLKAIHAQGDAAPLYVQELLTHLHECISVIARIPAPVIAGINGTAAGAGFALACACDLLIAARSARFLMAYTRVGLTPDGSSTWYLPRLVGLHRALALTLLNDEISAETLQTWGVVLDVVDDDALERAALELAGRLVNGSMRASGAAKRLLRSASGRSLESQMIVEAETLCHALVDEEGRAGLAAFNNRRNDDTGAR